MVHHRSGGYLALALQKSENSEVPPVRHVTSGTELTKMFVTKIAYSLGNKTKV